MNKKFSSDLRERIKVNDKILICICFDDFTTITNKSGHANKLFDRVYITSLYCEKKVI